MSQRDIENKCQQSIEVAEEHHHQSLENGLCSQDEAHQRNIKIRNNAGAKTENKRRRFESEMIYDLGERGIP